MSIQFFLMGVKVVLKERKRLKAFIKSMFNHNGRKMKSLVIVFCTDEYLIGVNRKFLNHNYYTDIITFNLAEKSEFIEGEIYISTDRIRENALIHGVSVKSELHRVIFHGILHLCGYKDKLKRAKLLMTQMENNMLTEYFSR